MKRPIFEMLSSIKNRKSLHMPAHFGKSLFEYGDIFKLDTTEIDLCDNLYKPNGAIKEAQELLAQAANVKNAYFLHDGSSAGIRAMLLYAKHFGNKIIVPRNSHKSIYNFIAVIGLDPLFVKLSFTEDFYPYTSTEDIIDTINNNEASAIMITSPDYYGVCMDIEKIAKAAHNHNILVLCDQAHGAHLNWNKKIQNAGYYGADIFVQSAHKTLPCLTSNAWLLNKNADHELLIDCLQAIQTSSPSFISMMCMDDARAYMDEYSDCNSIENLAKNFGAKLEHFNLSHNLWSKYGFEFDESRLVIDCKNSADYVLQRLQDKGLDVEMSDGRRIVCILSQIKEECINQLDILETELKEIELTKEIFSKSGFPATFSKCMNISDAYFSKKEYVKLSEAEGRISGTIAGIYPPGIPAIVWGERINKEIINYLCESSDKCFGIKNKMIKCVVEE